MAANRTSIKPGQQLALKHGAYSATARLAHQNRILEEARERLRARKLGPLELEAYRTLKQTRKRLRTIAAWLNKEGIFESVKGRTKLRDAVNYEAALQKSVHQQTMALWRMLAATQPLFEDEAAAQAQDYLQRYAPKTTTPDPVTEQETDPDDPQTVPIQAVEAAPPTTAMAQPLAVAE